MWTSEPPFPSSSPNTSTHNPTLPFLSHPSRYRLGLEEQMRENERKKELDRLKAEYKVTAPPEQVRKKAKKKS